MRPSWVDAQVAMAWCRFFHLMAERDAPTELMELLTLVDRVLLSEALRQRTDEQHERNIRRATH